MQQEKDDKEGFEYEWNVAKSTPNLEDDHCQHNVCYETGRELLRIVMICFLFLAVLTGGVTSLLTLILAAANFRRGIRLLCDESTALCASLNVHGDPLDSVGSANDTRSDELLNSTSDCIANPQNGKVSDNKH